MADPFFKDLAFAALAQTARNPTRDFLQATPRNPILGYLSDLAASSYSPERTQQMQGVAKFMNAPAISETLDRLSYGEPLTTGAGGLGGTTRVRPEALEAAMAVAPTVVPALNLIRPAVKAGARALGPTAVSMGEGYLQRRGLMPELDVYHGSPYKFDRFDASKIGTGEGAQSYGYGLYFAENPAVSESYQKMISIGKQLDPLSKQAQKFVKENMIGGADNDAILKAAAASKNQAARWDLEDVKRGIPASRNDYVSAMDEVQEFLRKNPIAPNDGSLYKVNLPDEQIAKMLDYDKPFSEQPPNVQAALKSIVESEYTPKLAQSLNILSKNPLSHSLGTLDDQLGGKNITATYLQQAGVPGIKYLDEGSRGASGTGKWKLKFLTGEEKIYDFKPDDDVLKMMNATAEPHVTRNFVIFPGEEQSMTILERNNQPVQQAMNEFEQSLINFMATPAK